MTASYTNDPANRPIDRVRLEIDDRDTIPETDALLTDEEILFFIGDNPHILFASAAAADAIGAKFASDAKSKKVGDLEIDYGDGQAASYTALAKGLRTRAKGKAGAYGGGLSKADKKTADTDPDRVLSPFRMGMHDNPASVREDFS